MLATVRTNQLVIQLTWRAMAVRKQFASILLPPLRSLTGCGCMLRRFSGWVCMPRCPNSAYCSQEKAEVSWNSNTKSQLILSREKWKGKKKTWNAVAVGPCNVHITWKGRVEQLGLASVTTREGSDVSPWPFPCCRQANFTSKPVQFLFFL
jgi:hypothetical protein